MGVKTSQLQIRVTEVEKGTLKRLAAAAGLSVSRYVLSLALPAAGQELTLLVGSLGDAHGPTRETLQDLARFLSELPPTDAVSSLEEPPLERLQPVLRNQIAGMVEQAAHLRSVHPPAWVGTVGPPARPHFGWPLSSLRPHQLRVTPVPFKRRNVFFDPASPRGVPAVHAPAGPAMARPGQEPTRRLTLLAALLDSLELKVEFYLLGGALLAQAFHARPATAQPSALFAPQAAAWEAGKTLAAREGWPGDWLPGTVKELLQGEAHPSRYLDLPGLAVYVPPLEYALALKVGALRRGEGRGASEDVRYLLRALNVSDADVALAIATRYLGERAVTPDAAALLRELLRG